MEYAKAHIQSAEKFYDGISGFYEKMIDFEKNLELRRTAYGKIFDKPGTAADMGCGVGLDSLALALNGHKVSAFDISSQMIEETKLNAEKYGAQINTSVNSFHSVSKNYYSKFDYALSVGNTIAHLERKNLALALKKMYNMLLPGGKIFLHILNYDLIRKEGKRINNIAVRDGRTIIRFYDFGKDNLDFNILTFLNDSPKNFTISTTKHYPHKKNEIEVQLKKNGFGRIKFMKNFSGEKFQPANSKDIFVSAVK